MLPTQELIDHLAGRIERAYGLRQQRWCRSCSTKRVWSAAAVQLWQSHVDDPRLPLDCELYVAAQVIDESLSDPWSELAQPAAARRYRRLVLKIITRLRTELKKEIDRAELAIEEMVEVGSNSVPEAKGISALGYYIAAQRNGMSELADRFVSAASEQHRSCPLYQFASLPFLSSDLYPDLHSVPEPAHESGFRSAKSLIIMN